MSDPTARLTLARARLIVRNRLAYAPHKVREAAVWLHVCPDATSEDVQNASYAIAIGTRDRPSRQFMESLRA